MVLSSQKILVLERFVAFYKCRRRPLWFLHVSPVVSGCPWFSSWHSKMLQLIHLYCLTLNPTMVKCKEGLVTERQKQNYLQQLHCLHDPFLRAASLSFLPWNTAVPLCSQPWESFSGKVNHGFCLYGCVFKNETAVRSSSLCVLSTVSGFRSLPYGQVFFTVNMGSCLRDLIVTPLVKLPSFMNTLNQFGFS